MEKTAIVPVSQRINGAVTEAIRAYTAMGVPVSQLLSDYNAILTFPELLEQAVNPWESIHNRKGTSVVCGVSAAETLFNVSAMSLYRQSPITVIKSIYYRNKNRNDSALERVFLNLVQDSITADQRIMIINPSPFVVESIEKTRKGIVYAVIDETLSSLYSKQFKHSEFVSIDSIHSISVADVIFFFTTNIDDTSLQRILEYIGTVHTSKIAERLS